MNCLKNEDIRDVEINDTSSFVSAPFSVAQAILKAYSDRTMKGKPIVMRAKPEGGNEGARGESFPPHAFPAVCAQVFFVEKLQSKCHEIAIYCFWQGQTSLGKNAT